MFWNAITVIEAQQMLNQISVSSFYQMDQKNRTALIKKLNKEAYPQHLSKKVETISNKRLAELLGAR